MATPFIILFPFVCFRLEIYPEGKHNIHLRYAELFNSAVDDFLAEDL